MLLSKNVVTQMHTKMPFRGPARSLKSIFLLMERGTQMHSSYSMHTRRPSLPEALKQRVDVLI